MARIRLYIPHEERRLSPEPARTRDTVPVLIGLAAWIVALVVVLTLSPAAWAAPDPTPFWVVVAGLGGGLLLLAFAWRHDRG